MIIISDEEHQAVLDGAAPADFGSELILDLGGCNPDTIRDPEAIGRWLVEIVEVIGMTRHGEAHVERFGEDELYGTTGVQLITTSSVVVHGIVHAVDDRNSVHLNVFSCRPFDASKAAKFCVDFFAARAYKARVVSRRAPAVPAQR